MKSLTTDQANQDRFREAWKRLFDLTHDLLGIVGFDGCLKQVNPAWSRTLGCTEKELLENLWVESVHPEDRPAALAAGEELLAGKPVLSLENRYQCREGSYRRISWDSFPDMEKRLIMFVGRDITESRRAEESLRQSEETLRALLDSNPESLLLMDEQLTVVTANQTAAQRLGKRLDELIGTNLDDLFPEEVFKLRKTYSDEVFRRGQPIRFKDTHRGRDFYTYAHPVRDAAGKVSRIAVLGVDITESRRAEEALLESEKRFRDVIENAQEWVWEVDARGRYTYASPIVEKLLGYKPEEVLEKHFYDLFHPEEREELKNLAFAAFAAKQPFKEFINRNLHKDGRDVWFSTSGVPILDKTGNLSGYRGADIDITEPRKAEEALRKTEEKYRSIFENAVEGIFQSTPKGRFISVNPAMARMFGYESPDELLAEIADITTQFYVDPQRRAEFQRLMARDGFVKDFEYQVYRKDGKKLLISENARAVRNEKGDILYYEGFMQDFTERKLAEDKLREQLAFEQVLMDTIPSPIFYKNVQGIYLGCNKALGDFLGLTKEDIIGKSVYDIYPKDLANKYFEMDSALFRRPGVQIYDFSMLHADGARHDVTFYKATYSATDGALAGMVGVMIDISDRKRGEEALRESEQRLANIIDFLPDATMVIDKEGTVIAWNQAMEELTGVKTEDMAGKGNYEYALPFYGERRPILIDLVHNPQEKLEKYAEVKREGLSLSAVGHFPTFQGREAYLFGKAGLLRDSHGNYAGAIESIRDITDLQKAEAERLRLGKLESLGLMAGGIAHDFNNILTAIIGNISMAMLDHKMAGQAQERLMAAEKACLQAQTLARQLLTFAKGGAPVKKITSVATTIDESVMFACRGFKTRCELRISDDLWCVEADSGQLGQVFQNLIINAVQAMPAGGTIDIDAENLRLKASRDLPLSPGKYVKISIRDQGIGIPAEYLPKIFDPYFTTKQAGSGLGLATAFSIIQNHHGHISVESILGAGTTFHIFLPASDHQMVRQPEPERKALLGKGKVLVMDDEEMVREVLGKMLANLGYEAKFAQDGAEAVEKFAAAQKTGGKFQAVILDLTVPGGVGGKDTIKKLLDIDPQVKAIVSSGYSDDPIMANFKAYGFSGVIAKPYKVLDLAEVLHDIILGM